MWTAPHHRLKSCVQWRMPSRTGGLTGAANIMLLTWPWSKTVSQSLILRPVINRYTQPKTAMHQNSHWSLTARFITTSNSAKICRRSCLKRTLTASRYCISIAPMASILLNICAACMPLRSTMLMTVRWFYRAILLALNHCTMVWQQTALSLPRNLKHCCVPNW